MSDLGDELDRAFNEFAAELTPGGDWTSPGGVRSLGEYLAAGTGLSWSRALSNELGVTMRTVQRWAADPGSGKQHRTPKGQNAEQLQRVGNARTAEALAEAIEDGEWEFDLDADVEVFS